jgi:hypothetical protein
MAGEADWEAIALERLAEHSWATAARPGDRTGHRWRPDLLGRSRAARGTAAPGERGGPPVAFAVMAGVATELRIARLPEAVAVEHAGTAEFDAVLARPRWSSPG